MKSEWDVWLRELAAQQMGGRDMVLPAITRGKAWLHVLSIEADVHADAFAADLRLSPDADAAPLVAVTVAVGAFASGATPVTLSLTDVQTALTGDQDADFDGLSEAVFNLFHTPAGGTQYRAAGTTITIAE